MKLNKSIILGAAGIMMLSSCSDWLDVNVDPNNPSSESARYDQRLAWIEYYANQTYQTASEIANYACGDYATASLTHARGRFSQWLMGPGRSQTCYQSWFNGAGANINPMIESATAAGAWHYAGATYLLRAYGFSVLNDCYSEFPYSQALGSNVTPDFDNGKAIFEGILKDIDTGLELLARPQENGTSPLSANDSWANGDVSRWIKFGNLLKARTLLKLTRKGAGSAADLKYDADEILRCLDKSFTGNDDAIVLNHTDLNGTINDPLGINERLDFATMFSNTGMNSNIYVTQMLVDNFTNFDGKGIEDPRADKIIPWAASEKTATTPADLKWSADGKWRRSIGLDTHKTLRTQKTPSAVSWDGKDNRFLCKVAGHEGDTIYVHAQCGSTGYSGMPDLLKYYDKSVARSAISGSFMLRAVAPGMVGTYHEVCFIRAEVLFNKGDRNGAFNAYKAGIRAHIELMNKKLNEYVATYPNLASCPSFTPMTQTDIDNYLNNAIGNAGDLTIGKIMTQKHMAMSCSLEQWNDMRRYDYKQDVFMNWEIPAEYYINTTAQLNIPLGKTFRRFAMPTYEQNYNADKLQAIGNDIPGAKVGYPGGWYKDPEVYTLSVWWDRAE